MSTVPVHRLTTQVHVQVEVTTNAPPSNASTSHNLQGPGGLHGRPPSPQASPGHSHRVRHPLPEHLGGSPRHDSGRLLITSERSDRFSDIDLNSGRPSRVSSRITLEISEVGSHRAGHSRPGSPPRGETLEGLERPRPSRSWKAVGTALVAALKRAGTAVLNELHVTVSIARLPKIPRHMLGALAGHSIHQTIAVGIPTFVREMVGIGVMHAMRAQPVSTAIGVQVTVGVTNVAIQAMREFRELRKPDVAARAYFSLSVEQWAAKSPEQQDAMKLHHRRMSRAITVIQVASSVTNLTMMVQNFAALDPIRNTGFAGRDHTAALRPLANEIKVGVYAAMRDGIQASFSMVGFKASTTAAPGHEFAAGMAGAAHAAAAATYAAANAGSAFLSDALMGAWVPGRSAAVATLMGDISTKMSLAEAWKNIAMGAGVSAMANTLAETIDWFQRMQHFVNQTGATQHWEPKLTGTDYGRLLDQAPARAAAFNGIFSALTLAGREMGKSDLPGPVQQFIGNAGLGVMIAMLDSPVSGIWQADEEVRAATRSSVRITEIETGGGTESPGGENHNSGSDSDGSQVTHMSAGNPPERHRTSPGRT